MRNFRQTLFLLVFSAGLLPVVSFAQPTFADLSVFLAKGYFKTHVASDASLEQCISFLNKKGVYFSIFDLMDSSVIVEEEDFARVVGQSLLLFLGEARVVRGRIEKPREIETWIDYCLLNDVDLQNLWRGFLQRTDQGSFSEVQQFFGNSTVTGDSK